MRARPDIGRRGHSLGPACALAILFTAATLFVVGSAMADDSTLPDHRRTASGKPLVYRSTDVSLDRDDQAASADADDRTAVQANRTALAARALEPSLTKSTTSSSTANQRRIADNSSAAPSDDQDAPPSTSRAVTISRHLSPGPGDGSRPPESLPSDPPLGFSGSGFNPSDLGRTDLVNGPPTNAPPDAANGPPAPHGDLPGSAWPHGYLRQQLEEPLVGASWCNEPYHIDWFLGVIRGTEIIHNHVDQNVGVIGGFRLGWDYDIYWGLETRLGFSSLEDQPENNLLAGGADKVILWDSSLVYYPWGDSRWRPYLSFGFGMSEFQFTDDLGNQIHRELLEIPLGIGMKYRLHDWLSLRADVTDNLALGSSGLATMNNFSFTTGMEFRFGGCHRSYWPWEPAAAH